MSTHEMAAEFAREAKDNLYDEDEKQPDTSNAMVDICDYCDNFNPCGAALRGGVNKMKPGLFRDTFTAVKALILTLATVVLVWVIGSAVWGAWERLG